MSGRRRVGNFRPTLLGSRCPLRQGRESLGRRKNINRNVGLSVAGCRRIRDAGGEDVGDGIVVHKEKLGRLTFFLYLLNNLLAVHFDRVLRAKLSRAWSVGYLPRRFRKLKSSALAKPSRCVVPVLSCVVVLLVFCITFPRTSPVGDHELVASCTRKCYARLNCINHNGRPQRRSHERNGQSLHTAGTGVRD